MRVSGFSREGGYPVIDVFLTLFIEPSRWGLAMALFMVGFISYGATLVFFAAAFPRLARNTAHSRNLRDKFNAGEVSLEEYEREESLEKNRISNISTVCCRTEYWVCPVTHIFLFSLGT